MENDSGTEVQVDESSHSSLDNDDLLVSSPRPSARESSSPSFEPTTPPLSRSPRSPRSPRGAASPPRVVQESTLASLPIGGSSNNEVGAPPEHLARDEVNPSGPLPAAAATTQAPPAAAAAPKVKKPAKKREDLIVPGASEEAILRNPKPKGRNPKGMLWDYEKGCWVRPVDGSTYKPGPGVKTPYEAAAKVAKGAKKVRRTKSLYDGESSSDDDDDFELKRWQQGEENQLPQRQHQPRAKAPPNPAIHWKTSMKNARDLAKEAASRLVRWQCGINREIAADEVPGKSLEWKPPHNPGPDPNPLSLPLAMNPPSVVQMVNELDRFKYGPAPLSTMSSSLLPAQAESLRYYRNTSYKEYLEEMAKSPALQDPQLLVSLPPLEPLTFTANLIFTLDEGCKISLSPSFTVSDNMTDFDLYVAELGRMYGLDILTMGVIRQDIEKAYQAARGFASEGGRTGVEVGEDTFDYCTHFQRTCAEEQGILKEALATKDKEEVRNAGRGAEYEADLATAESLDVNMARPEQSSGKPRQSNGAPIIPTNALLSAECNQFEIECSEKVKAYYTKLTHETRVEFPNKAHCHLCHKYTDGTCLKFGPGCNHSFCSRHVKLRLGVSIESLNDPSRPVKMKCPVCSLSCTCRSCVKRLIEKTKKYAQAENRGEEAISKWKKLEQGYRNKKTGGGGDIVPGSGSSQASHSERKRKRTFRAEDQEGDSEGGGIAQNLKMSDPREGGGRAPYESKPASKRSKSPMPPRPASKAGASSKLPAKASPAKGSPAKTSSKTTGRVKSRPSQLLELPPEVDVVEDGNVDFCAVCSGGGGLLCCDKCPRAFHTKCIMVNEDELPPGDWECLRCKKNDLEISENELVNVHESNRSHRLRDLLKGIVTILEGYDFGYAFQEPVLGETYERVIESPMCYDWILAKLDAGTYEDLLPDYLKDMLLVYENCYRFNAEGSAIFRMAEVHERKFNALLGQVDIPKEVDEQVKRWVKGVKEDRLQYIKLCAKSRSTTLPKYNIAAWKRMEMTQEYAIVQEKNLRPLDDAAGKKNKKNKGLGVYIADYETGWILDTWPTLKMAHKAFPLFEISSSPGKKGGTASMLVDQMQFKSGITKNIVYQVVDGPRVWFGSLQALKRGVVDVGLVTRWQDEAHPEDVGVALGKQGKVDSHEEYEPESMRLSND